MLKLSYGRGILLGLFFLMCSSSIINAQDSSLSWGRIANTEHYLETIRGALFFAGPPNPNSLQFYTRHPLDNERFNWQTNADADFIIRQIKETNINVIKLSWWGHNDEYIQWAPTLNDEAVNLQVFSIANSYSILVAPLLEVSPAFKFWEEYPNSTTNLEERISYLLRTYGNQPNWLKLYDKQGNPRLVIWLIETVHVGQVDVNQFARVFDDVASRIKDSTGFDIGFIIDPTPLPPNGSYEGPDSMALKSTESLLAINPFNITSDGITEDERLSVAESILAKWHNSGLPLITNVLPGFDDHLVRSPPQVYGNNSVWRNKVKNLAFNYQTAGITLDVWNGFTEGYSFVPTVEDGDANYLLAKNIFANYSLTKGTNLMRFNSSITLFPTQYFNLGDCPLASIQDVQWKPYVIGYNSNATTIEEAASSSNHFVIICKRSISQ